MAPTNMSIDHFLKDLASRLQTVTGDCLTGGKGVSKAATIVNFNVCKVNAACNSNYQINGMIIGANNEIYH